MSLSEHRVWVILSGKHFTSESVNEKNNNFYLTSERYNSLLNEVEEAKRVKGKQTVHYRWLKRYDIINIGGEEKLTVPLSAEKTEIL